MTRLLLALVLAGCAEAAGPDPVVAVDDETAAAVPSTPPKPPAPPAADVPAAHKGLIVGSWTPDGELGFDEQWLDENGLREVFTKELASRRAWRGFSTPTETIPADALLDDRDGDAVGYVYTLVQRRNWEDDHPATLHVTHRGRVQVRFDGQVVTDEPASRSGIWQRTSVPVTLTGAFDVVLVKVARGPGGLGLSMDVQIRVSHLDGSAIEGQSWNSMRPPDLPRDIP